MSRHQSLWAFDPGQTTGVAHIDLVDRAVVRLEEIDLWRGIDGMLSEGDIVVYERLTWRSPSFNPIGMQVVGVIEYLSGKIGCECLSQSPGDIVGPLKWPIYNFTPIKSQHKRDALAHAIIFMQRRYQHQLQFDGKRFS